MKLYSMSGACSLASHIALVWADAAFDVEELSHDALGTETFRAINPKGAVPALVLDDGTVITESLAVLAYIAERFPAAHLGAEPGDLVSRAKLNEALAYLVSDVHKAWAPFFAPSRFVTREAHEEEARQAAFVQLDARYEALNRQMNGQHWLVFGRRTVADAYLYVMCRWKDLTPTPLSAFPVLATFKATMDEDAGVRRALAAYRRV